MKKLIIGITFGSLQAASFSSWKGDQLYKKGELEKARATYEEAVMRHPDDMEALYKVGKTAYTMKDYSAAIQAFEKVARSDKSSPSLKEYASFNKGDSFLSQHHYESALKAYQEVLALNPTNEHAQKRIELTKKLMEEQKQKEEQERKEQDKNKKETQDKEQERRIRTQRIIRISNHPRRTLIRMRARRKTRSLNPKKALKRRIRKIKGSKSSESRMAQIPTRVRAPNMIIPPIERSSPMLIIQSTPRRRNAVKMMVKIVKRDLRRNSLTALGRVLRINLVIQSCQKIKRMIQVIQQLMLQKKV